MAYHGYVPACKKFLCSRESPNFLEVGVDRGVTFISLVAFLARAREKSLAVGVDVFVQEQVEIMLAFVDRTMQQQAFLLEGNSLDVLPKLIEQGVTFDLLLLDGDHNYFTVSQELALVDKLLKPDGILIIDDYNGRWGRQDLFYSEREGYENNSFASKRVETERHGVGSAVDDWLASAPSWTSAQFLSGEPIVIARDRAKLEAFRTHMKS